MTIIFFSFSSLANYAFVLTMWKWSKSCELESPHGEYFWWLEGNGGPGRRGERWRNMQDKNTIANEQYVRRLDLLLVDSLD